MPEVSPGGVKPGCDESSLKAAEIRRDLIILVVLSIGWEKILDPIPHYCIAHFKVDSLILLTLSFRVILKFQNLKTIKKWK